MAGIADKFHKMWNPPEDEMDYEYDDEMDMEDAPQQEEPDEAPARRAPVTGKPDFRTVQGGAQHLKVVLFKPEKFGEETRAIADQLVQSSTVVLNMEKAGDDTCRIIDFLSGVAYANNGTVKWVSKNTYIIAPKNVDFTGGDPLDGMDTDNVYL